MSEAGSSFLLQPDNWYELLLPDLRSKSPRLALADASGDRPLLLLSRAEQHFVLDQFESLLLRLEHEWDSLETILLQFRAALIKAANSAFEGSDPAQLQLPGIDHPALAEPRSCASLCAGLPCLAGLPSLQRWAKQLVKSKKLVERSWDEPMLRALLEIAASQGAESLLPSLRKIHGRAFTAEQQSTQLALAEEYGFAPLLRQAQDWLGLHRRRRRRRPFVLGKSRKRSSPSESPDVSVLLLDSGRRRGKSQSLSSLEAQSLAPREVTILEDDGDLIARISQVCTTASSSWVSFLRAGDLYHPQRIEACRDAIQHAPMASLVCSGVYFTDAKGLQVSAQSCNRLEQGSLIFDWLQRYERLRPRSTQASKLLLGLQAADFVLSPSNLFCRRKFLLDEIDGLVASPASLGWQLAFIAAQKARLVYDARKLLALPIPKSREVFIPKWASTSQPRLLSDHLLLRLLSAAQRHQEEGRRSSQEQASPLEASPGMDELEVALAKSLVERDRLARDVKALRRNRDGLELLLTERNRLLQASADPAEEPHPSRRVQALSPPSRSTIERPLLTGLITGPLSRAQGGTTKIACTLPPDQESWQQFRRFCAALGSRPELLYWQGESSRLGRGNMLRTDRDAQDEDLGFLRRSRGPQLHIAMELFSEALGRPSIELEAEECQRRAFTFARKIGFMRPDYLHSWGLGSASAACLLSQLLDGMRRGLVLSSLPSPASPEARLLALHLASASLLIVSSEELRARLVTIGVEKERVFLSGSEAGAAQKQLRLLVETDRACLEAKT